ncbi:MAG: hypothetical protein ACI9XB_001980 [Gammaproteobacteria bacterium]|jgi:hypothetical protein
MKNISATIVCLLISIFATAQVCDCLISEVEMNTVNFCNYTIGTVVTVNNETEFVNAVNQANNNGGNMTILIADGTYQIASTSWYPYITASNVVFRSLSGNRDAVILTGSGMADVSSTGTEVVIYAVGDNITIADLTIKDVGNHGIAVTGDNLYVYNVKIQNTYEQMIKGNSSGNGINNGKVKCSLFEYTNGIGPQWYIGGLDIHTGTNWTVSDNVFKNISSPSFFHAEHAIHFWDSSADNLIERNKILNCDRGIGFGLGSSPNSGGVIKNNMITNDGTGLFHDVGIGIETSPNTKIYNNTIHVEYQNAIEYRFASTTNVEISNNLTNKLIKSRNGGSATLATNIENAVSSWFVDLTTGDLHLVSNISVAVDMGTTLTGVTKDIDKVARPQFSSFDIGACEYLNPLSTVNFDDPKNKTIAYPSPSSTQITINSILNENSTLTIYNAYGQKTGVFTNVNLKNGFIIDVNNWAEGIYYCNIIYSDKYNETIKMVVSK